MTKPLNVLMIITDQQRADTIAAAKNQNIYTPNLDRLCESGVLYEKAYSEMPECCPARSLIFSGRWGHNTGNMGNGYETKLASTFVEKLNEAGYNTGYIGKMHSIPPDNTWGFQTIFSSEEGAAPENDDYCRHVKEQGYDEVYEPCGIRHEYYYIPQVSQLPDRLHNTTWIGDRTVEWIEQANETDTWFLTASFIKPHPPFDPTTPYLTRYDPAALPLPVRSADDKDKMWPLQQAQNYSKWMEQTDDNLTRLIKSAYYASITQLDTQIGRILDMLESKGLRERTLIVFTSDHGEMLGDHYQWGKRSFYNGAAKIPLILSCPGSLPEGKTTSDLVGHRDIAPTLLHAAGVSFEPDEYDGESLLERQWENTKKWRNTTYGELITNTYGMMSKDQATQVSSIYMSMDHRWKYIYAPNGGMEALFDLENDPDELCNLVEFPEGQEARGRLRNSLLQMLKKDGFAAGLSADGEDLLKVPYSEVPAPRNRQYSGYDPYSPKGHHAG